ncbi:hypothetical protein [Acidipropionibacterium jensenii]|uniref:hypothetical protein n=1 Tax=Acidipropionibacterium jensenii TaxID=1749 RepID=UPI00214AD21A|nr:hypothetical protein [Acidipropionibacterium jensenii]
MTIGSDAVPLDAAASRCWAAVAAVLTGERLAVPATAGWQADSLADWLESQGWDSARLARRRRRCQQERRPWPQRLPDDLAAGLEFARYYALLAQLRKITGLDGMAERIHHGPIIIGPEEQRLLREVPPHSVQR